MLTDDVRTTKKGTISANNTAITWLQNMKVKRK